ncbi:PTS sugar transporter subunit IIA [Bacillus fonticola]|uniref:PTS sugar transporter subunit IIA n=1 Tax=Bacillus fonticola TaxID=2728853 RepID=UPI001473854D|nr:PTS sugar transporter subunit IIA [Bacillus fonticola]
MQFLGRDLVTFQVDCQTAEEAIVASGKLLEQQNTATNNYVKAMVQSFQKNGPYFVLAPSIAMPHARPEDGVKEAAVSLVQLKKPVVFGHRQNDPVDLVFGLGASSNGEHLTLLRRLMALCGDAGKIAALKQARQYEDIQNLVDGVKA